MKLILVRHGLAEEKDVFLQSQDNDSLRPLTPKGRKRIQILAEKLSEWVDDLGLIVSSPYVRAHQTAEILAKSFPKANYVDVAELVPLVHPQAFLKWLRMNGGSAKTLIAVGHEPHLSLLSSFLLQGTLNSFIEIKKGGVVAFEIDSWENIGPETAHLIWVLPPKLINASV